MFNYEGIENKFDQYYDYKANVKTLREEASELKECFNRQCFQVIAIISMLFVYLFHVILTTRQVEDTLTFNFNIGIGAYIALILITTVLNVGIYKFEAANRLIGYILHLERKYIHHYESGAEQFSIFYWETLIKAWRVFHPAVENEMYIRWSRKNKESIGESFKSKNFKRICCCLKEFLSSKLFKGKLKKEYADDSMYRWYLPGKLVHSEAEYSPGNYLKRMMFMLHLLGVIALLLITLATFLGNYPSWLSFILKAIWFPAMVLFFVTMWYRPRNLSIRIERELFCIHSVSIFWSVVDTAHKRAIEIIQNRKTLKHYSFLLSCLSLHFIEFGIDRAHEWCEDDKKGEIAQYIIQHRLDDYPPNLRNELVSDLSIWARLDVN